MESRAFPYRHNPYIHSWKTVQEEAAKSWPPLHQPPPPRGRTAPEDDPLRPCCSLLTILVLFLVLLGVLAVSGLALYIGALRLEPVQSLLWFDGSLRLASEKFTPGLANRSGLDFIEKSNRYKTLLEAVYGKSRLGQALHEVYVTGFANGSLIIFFRIVLDRRKIPKPISGLEESLKRVILEEAASPLSILSTLKIDSNQLHIKRVLLEEKPESRDKERQETAAGGLRRPPTSKFKKKYNSPPKAPWSSPGPPLSTNSPPQGEPVSVEASTTSTTTTTSTTPLPVRKTEPPSGRIEENDWRPFNPPPPPFDLPPPPDDQGGRGFQGHAEVVLGGGSEGLLLEMTAEPPLPSLPIEGQFAGDIVTLLPARSNLGPPQRLHTKPTFRPRRRGEAHMSLQNYYQEAGGGETTQGEVEETVKPTSPTTSGGQRSVSRRPKSLPEFPEGLNFTGRIESQVRLLIEEMFNITSSPSPPTTLSPSSVREMTAGLDKLAKLKVSQKAISSGHQSNTPFRLLTKVFNRASLPPPAAAGSSTTKPTPTHGCGEKSMLCGSGECIPLRLRCNRLADCRDSSDEKNCSCAQLLKSQFQGGKICDGINDCADLSDETGCEWCPGGESQYQCSNAKVCIDPKKVCDGRVDCPRGDDEASCLALRSNSTDSVEKNSGAGGVVEVQKEGGWGKLCLENASNLINSPRKEERLEDMGVALCRQLTYSTFVSIQTVIDESSHSDTIYYEIDEEPTENTTLSRRSKLVFSRTDCRGREIAWLHCKDLKCGLRMEPTAGAKKERRSRIVGGENAGAGSWPWQAALYKEGEYQCGATLISSRWLISAAHCFYRAENDYWTARLGALRKGGPLSFMNSPPSLHEQSRRVASIILHPSYQDAGFLHDICLLGLESPLQMTPYVRPICPATSTSALSGGRMCTVIGWGQLSESGRLFPDTLQEVEVPIIPAAECRRRTSGLLQLYKVTEDMFCAGFERGGRDACLGDSGGPLMCQEADGHWVLHGVTSNGYGCARANRPGVYTKVAAYTAWISGVVSSDLTSGPLHHRPPPRCPGHRCPLGECLPPSRLCNGYTECTDSSDEALCW